MIKKITLIIVVFLFGMFIGNTTFKEKVETQSTEILEIQKMLQAEDADYSKIFLLLLAHLNLSHNFSEDTFTQTPGVKIPAPKESENSQDTEDSQTSQDFTNSQNSQESQISQNSYKLPTDESQRGQESFFFRVKELYKAAFLLVAPIRIPHGEFEFRFNSNRFTNAKNANRLVLKHALTHNGRFFTGDFELTLLNQQREIAKIKTSGPNTTILSSQFNNSPKVLLEISDYIFVFDIKNKGAAQEVYLEQGNVYFKNNFEEVIKFTPLGKFHLIKLN